VITTVDEDGNGTILGGLGLVPLPSGFEADPGPGGLASALTYGLDNPPGLIAGDVFLLEGLGGPISDVIRFNPQQTCPGGSVGCLVFYSDNLDGVDALADTGFPTANYLNTITLVELAGGTIYTPTVGQPGFVAGAGLPVTYVLISDVEASVPEPASIILLTTAFLGAGAIEFRRRARSRHRMPQG
jgi:hypothetical protein